MMACGLETLVLIPLVNFCKGYLETILTEMMTRIYSTAKQPGGIRVESAGNQEKLNSNKVPLPGRGNKRAKNCGACMLLKGEAKILEILHLCNPIDVTTPTV